MDYKKLKGKVALITGASRGIGKAIAIEFAKEGANVIITYKINKEKAISVIEEIERLNSKAMHIKLDQRYKNDIDKTIEEVYRSFGRIDILVNNAAIAQEKPFQEITEEDWDNMLAINLKGPFMLCQAVIPKMIEQQWGRIINIVSIGGQWGGFNQVHYAAAKAGLINLTHSIAKIYSQYGITSNAVSPGLVETEMSKNELNTQRGREKVKNIPLGRIARPEEVAKAVVFLASEDATYITGQTINVNGGMLFSHGV